MKLPNNARSMQLYHIRSMQSVKKDAGDGQKTNDLICQMDYYIRSYVRMYLKSVTKTWIMADKESMQRICQIANFDDYTYA